MQGIVLLASCSASKSNLVKVQFMHTFFYEIENGLNGYSDVVCVFFSFKQTKIDVSSHIIKYRSSLSSILRP